MHNKKTGITRVLNALGTIGYMTALLQWFWVIIIFLPSIAETPLFKNLILSNSTETTPVQVATSTQGITVPPVALFIGIVIGIIIIISFLYILIFKIPRTIADTGRKATHIPAEVITPIIIKHAHLKPADRRALPQAIVITLKALITFTPLVLLTFAGNARQPISYELIIFLGFILFSWTFFMFTLQLLLSRFFKIEYSSLR